MAVAGALLLPRGIYDIRTVETMKIQTERLTLRPFVPADAAAASCNSKQPSVAHYLSDMVLDSPKEARAWIRWVNKRSNDKEPFRAFAIERRQDAALLGLVGVAPKKELDGEIEILYAIADEYQGCGYAAEAGRAMLWWAFEQAGQEVLSALVQPENKASRRVIEKLGFVYCDSRVLPHDGENCTFDYFRRCHTDTLPGPDWTEQTLYRPEKMADFFNARAQGYDAHMLNTFPEDIYQRLGSFLPETDAALRVLDIGCGTGLELRYLWEKAPNAQVTCVDLSAEMLRLLRENHTEKARQITAVQASYLDWAYPPAAFDLVVSCMTLHHLLPQEKQAVYQNIRRSLRPGGCYLECDFIVDSPQAAQYRRRYEAIRAFAPESTAQGAYHIDIPCDLAAQQQLLQKSGFSAVETLADCIRPHGSYAILRGGC